MVSPVAKVRTIREVLRLLRGRKPKQSAPVPVEQDGGPVTINIDLASDPAIPMPEIRLSALDELLVRAYQQNVDVKLDMYPYDNGQVVFAIRLQSDVRIDGHRRVELREVIDRANMPIERALRFSFDCVAQPLVEEFDDEPWRPLIVEAT
ncbi:MAG: hypothetical protein OET63_04910 [Desulfobacterales bacterium]|nr:hypothetical protein [Desulfobacterales bacterium]